MNQEKIFAIVGCVMQGISLLSYIGFGIRFMRQDLIDVQFHHFISSKIKIMILVALCFSNFLGIAKWGVGIDFPSSSILVGIQRWILLSSFVAMFLEFGTTVCNLCKFTSNPNFIQRVKREFSLPKYQVFDVLASRGMLSKFSWAIILVACIGDLILSVLGSLSDAKFLPWEEINIWFVYFRLGYFLLLIGATSIHYFLNGALIHRSTFNINGLWVAKIATSFLILFNIGWIVLYGIWIKFVDFSSFEKNAISLAEETSFVAVQTIFYWLLSKR